MIATPSWVGDVTAIATAFVTVAAAVTVVVKLLAPGVLARLRSEIETIVHPLRNDIGDMRSELMSHRTEAQLQSASVNMRLDRGTEVMAELVEQGREHDRRLRDVEEQFAEHISSTNAHGLPRPGGRL